jgi:hypothetical protein
MNRLAVGCALALTLAMDDACAASPMFVDDARILDAKSCQLEAWVRRNRESSEAWALPACNFTGHFDLTFGGMRLTEDGRGAFSENVIQVKTVLRPLEEDGWGVGLVAGSVRHLKRETANGWPGDAYVNVPLSLAFAGDAVVIHVNAGAAYYRVEKATIGLWGLGGEIRLRDDLSFNSEIFRIERGRPFYQLGLRYTFVKDRVQMDATYGNRAVSDKAARWFSLGLRFLTPPFLP